MIEGIILDEPVRRTSFGLEYSVLWDHNPDAKSQSGTSGSAIGAPGYGPGDRVTLQYRTTASYGLWFITGRSQTAVNPQV